MDHEAKVMVKQLLHDQEALNSEVAELKSANAAALRLLDAERHARLALAGEKADLVAENFKLKAANDKLQKEYESLFQAKSRLENDYVARDEHLAAVRKLNDNANVYARLHDLSTDWEVTLHSDDSLWTFRLQFGDEKHEYRGCGIGEIVAKAFRTFGSDNADYWRDEHDDDDDGDGDGDEYE